MNKSIKFSLIALLFVTTLPMLGGHVESGTTGRTEAASSSPRSQAETERARQQQNITERLKDRPAFFHSDHVTKDSLSSARITDHDNASINGLRRWWDRHVGEKGNLTIVIDAFKRLKKFDKFTPVEKEAFKTLSTNDQITLVREYLDKLKTITTKDIQTEQISFKNSETKINDQIIKLKNERKELQDEKDGLEGKVWNIYRFKHIFKNDAEKNAKISEIDNEIKQKTSSIRSKTTELSTARVTSSEKEKNIENNLDREVNIFTKEINDSLKESENSKNIQLRFDIKINTFQVHKKDVTLQPIRSNVIEIPKAMDQAAQEQAQRDRQAEERRAQEERTRSEEQHTPGKLAPALLSSEKETEINFVANRIEQKIIDMIKSNENYENKEFQTLIGQAFSLELNTIHRYDNIERSYLNTRITDSIQNNANYSTDQKNQILQSINQFFIDQINIKK